jgi:arylsulfatase A-like enzyme
MPRRPNILLITADQMRWDAICGRSICRTPNVNRLAGQGLSFDRSYTPVSLCCPARAMLLSGAYPWHNGVYHQVHVPMSLSPDMAAGVQTYPQRLSDAGYRCGYVGKWHASRLRGPLDFGYDVMAAPVQFCVTAECKKRHNAESIPPGLRDTSKPYETLEPITVTWPGGDRMTMCAAVRAEPEATQEHFIAAQAAETLRQFAAQDRPWLLEVHFPEPHDPYKPLEQFLDQYPPDQVRLPESYYQETFAGKPALLAREAGLWAQLSEADVREVLRHYWAYCQQVDRAVGIVLDALDQAGQTDRTLTVFTSDHGDNVGAHRTFIKGWTPYEETHRIPMVARWPGVIPAGASTDALVQLHDWAHTFVSAAGAPALPYGDGRDLTALLADPAGAAGGWPQHILNVFYGSELLYTQRIAIGRRHKYVFNGFDRDELYDLQSDPGELRNLADDPASAEIAQDMRDAMWELMLRHHDPYTQLAYGAARYLIGPRGGRPARIWPREYLNDPDHPFLGRLSGGS